jgi:hypothetical protein
VGVDSIAGVGEAVGAAAVSPTEPATAHPLSSRQASMAANSLFMRIPSLPDKASDAFMV